MLLAVNSCRGSPPQYLQGKIGFSSVKPTDRRLFGWIHRTTVARYQPAMKSHHLYLCLPNFNETHIICTLLTALLICVGAMTAQETSTQVWANLGAHVYHCRGSPFYGNTKAGAYMLSQSCLSGFRAAGGIAHTGGRLSRKIRVHTLRNAALSVGRSRS